MLGLNDLADDNRCNVTEPPVTLLPPNRISRLYEFWRWLRCFDTPSINSTNVRRRRQEKISRTDRSVGIDGRTLSRRQAITETGNHQIYLDSFCKANPSKIQN
jgi:hypothetical protein